MAEPLTSLQRALASAIATAITRNIRSEATTSSPVATTAATCLQLAASTENVNDPISAALARIG